MAVRSRAGVSAATVGLVIFVLLTVVAAVAAILIYAQLAKSQERFAEKDESLARFVSTQEQSNREIQSLREAAGERGAATVVGALLAERSALRLRFSGDPSHTLTQISEALADTGAHPDDPALTAISSLRAQLQALTKERDDLRTGAESLREQITEKEEQIARLNQTHQDNVGSLSTEVQTIGKDVDVHFEATAKTLDEIETNYKTQLDTKRNDLRQSQAKIAELQGEIDELRDELDRLRGKFRSLGRVSAPDMTKLVDGRVVEIAHAENLVYIDLGRRDKIFLGMTFEVFDPTRGVVVDESGQQRGKASIEVVDVAETSATCRVVRETLGRPVLADDLVSNIAYDQNMVFKFVVHGDFDLDYDGRTSITDRQRVETLIEEWGGVVLDELTLDTDFLVVGVAPPPARALSPDEEINPIDLAAQVQAHNKWREYQQVGEQARDMTIPVLNQNRFLVLIGYFVR
ncbi:MAG: hypothetical protein CMJ49_04905 [Planctomycetaceae bacterium]|nr:hypothetical protein [Planctomycetaceae bacterium]